MKVPGEACFILGTEIHKDLTGNLLGLSHKTYIHKVLNRFGIKIYEQRDTFVVKGNKFSLRQCPNLNIKKKEKEKISYASEVESHMYS